MSFEHAAHAEHQPVYVNPYEELLQEEAKLRATIEEIDDNLAAPNFNPGDTREVERNREYFSARRTEVLRRLAFHSMSIETAA